MAPPASPGERIGRYVVESALGHGGVAHVYLAWDEKLRRRVAIKILGADAGNATVRRRFQLEAQAIAALDHPRIVRCLDFSDEDSPLLYLVMEYVEGRSLETTLQERGLIPEQVALAIGYELATALEHAHASRVLHRDIKPSNVILSKGRAVLIDFGGIKLLEAGRGPQSARLRNMTQAVGTPGFMAPEQFLGRKIDERTDLFAVGALLYNLTTRAVPYAGRDLDSTFTAARRGRYRDPRDFQPLLTPGFCALIGDCIAARPAERIKTAAQLRQRIEQLLVSHGAAEVGATLLAYENAPDEAAVENDARSVQALTRDLRVALLRHLVAVMRERNRVSAARLLRRIRLAMAMDAEQLPAPPLFPAGAPHTVLQSSTGRRRRSFALGLAAGLLLSLGLALGSLQLGLLGPRTSGSIRASTSSSKQLSAPAEPRGVEVGASMSCMGPAGTVVEEEPR